jgi:hypothetical protein
MFQMINIEEEGLIDAGVKHRRGEAGIPSERDG